MPVVDRESRKLLGLVSLDDLLKARTRHLEEERHREQTLHFPFSGDGTDNGSSGAATNMRVKSSESILQKV